MVNAANEGLRGGSVVDAAIHNAIGWSKLQKALRKIGHCVTGDVLISPGFGLRAKKIIHTPGPLYAAGPVMGKAGNIMNRQVCSWLVVIKNPLCLRQNMVPAQLHFLLISIGMYEYPIDRVTDVAMATVKAFVEENPNLYDEIRFVMFNEDDFSVGRRKLKEHFWEG